MDLTPETQHPLRSGSNLMETRMIDMEQAICALPKAELHVHIEGTIEADLLLTIADRNGISLPYKSAADVVAGQNKGKSDPKQNLDSFIGVLDVCRGVLRSSRDYEDITYGYLKKCQAENIVYAEIMFDPQQGLRQGVGVEAQIEALQSGTQAATRDFGVEAQWIMNFQRDWPAEEALGILEAVQPYRDQIVGIGLDNPERPDFPNTFASVFSAAKKDGYRLTSHCDVHIPNSIEHIRGCINKLGVERIDHGLNSIEDDNVVHQLIEKNIALTACPTRYAFQSETSAEDLAMMTGLLDRGVLISLNSDDPAQFGSGWLSQTLIEAQRTGDLSWETVTKFIRNGFISAWLSSNRKSAYLKEFDRSCEAIRQKQ
ncbi:MAG: adenosine deaminase [Rhodobacteraceae bacterium]|nr:adenosine deaminase [Paracoccaceae bacterium]